MPDCLLCLYEKSDCAYVRCDHTVYCKSCVHKLFRNNKLSNKCPLCTSITTYISSNCIGSCENKVTIINFMRPNNPKYVNPMCEKCHPSYVASRSFTNAQSKIDAIHEEILKIFNPMPEKHVKSILIILKASTTDTQWIKGFLSYYMQIKDETQNGKKYMFTPDQMKKIGKITEKLPITGNNYFIRNQLVTLCMFPWELPHDPFSHGLCYHGNFGEEPPSIDFAVNLVECNMNLWNGGYFKGT